MRYTLRRMMNRAPYIELNWEEPFDPLFGSPIKIPEHTVLWRGYDTDYPSVSERPAYFSSKQVANWYIKDSKYRLGAFITTRPLKILDFRFMKNLLSRLIQMHRSDKYIDEFAPVMLSFGLCSLGHQIMLLKNRYRMAPDMGANISNMEKYHRGDALIEQAGIRVAETTNDGGVMIFLKELFKDTFDGYISPRMTSYFHIERGEEIHPELILFNPKDARIVELSSYPTPIRIGNTSISGQQMVTFANLIKEKPVYILSHTGPKGSIGMRFVGGGVTRHPLDEYDHLVRSEKSHQANDKLCQKAGKRWNAKIPIVTDHRVTATHMSPFMSPISDKDIPPELPIRHCEGTW
jgi:hypothetical protein